MRPHEPQPWRRATGDWYAREFASFLLCPLLPPFSGDAAWWHSEEERLIRLFFFPFLFRASAHWLRRILQYCTSH
jgi:hypothetical protein